MLSLIFKSPCTYNFFKIFHPRESRSIRLDSRQSGRGSAQDLNREINLDSSVSLDKSQNKMADLDGIFKALRLVPEFDGNVNVLTRFIQLCDELVDEFVKKVSPPNKLSECALINGILNKITGPAARLINSNGISSNWTGIRKSLVNNFSDQRDETALYNDLAILSQGSDSPQEFYEKCQNLFSTLMTYVSLHEDVATTIEAKRDLYKKLTLQAFVRGLRDPLGSRIRCMRPERIEKALEFVQEEQNVVYLQQRGSQIPDKKLQPQIMPHRQLPAPPGFHMPQSRPFAFNMPGPSRGPFGQPMPPQAPVPWRSNANHQNQAGPSRTQQVFRALPPNYNPNNAFKVVPRNIAPQGNFQQARPMSGVSHFVPRQLPPSNAPRGHDWTKSGNPPTSNYFGNRELNYNDCSNYYGYAEYDTDYYSYYEPNAEYYEGYYYIDNDQACNTQPEVANETTKDESIKPANSSKEDFPDLRKLDKPK